VVKPNAKAKRDMVMGRQRTVVGDGLQNVLYRTRSCFLSCYRRHSSARDMTPSERPFADTLILPLRDELREDSRYDHWLRLADIALAAAREEQARIKEQIKPHVERYQQLRGQGSWQSRAKKK
jgi:hypothetical protein